MTPAREYTSMNDRSGGVLQSGANGPFTLRTDHTLSLHFDGLHIQSEMLIEDPFRLVLHYTQAMMAFKLFKQDPSHILIIGLGGGSLSKYCFRRFPDAKIVTIENSAEVIRLRDMFNIPEDGDRFEVIQADAADYMALPQHPTDILLLDGFTVDGMPEHLFSTTFYSNCYEALADGGILVANLVGRDPHLHEQIGRIAARFQRNCVIAYAKRCDNYIVMARKGTARLQEDVATDVRRLLIRHRKGLDIPYFQGLDDFYGPPR